MTPNRATACILSIVALACAMVEAEATAPDTPPACVVRTTALQTAISRIGGRQLVLYDAIVVSGMDDRGLKREGCSLFKRLVPRYRRLRSMTETCARQTPDVDFAADLRMIQADLGRAETFIYKARCK